MALKTIDDLDPTIALTSSNYTVVRQGVEDFKVTLEVLAEHIIQQSIYGFAFADLAVSSVIATITQQNLMYNMNTTAAPLTLTLPFAGGGAHSGAKVIVQNKAGANTVTVTYQAGVDVILSAGKMAEFVFNGTAWIKGISNAGSNGAGEFTTNDGAQTLTNKTLTMPQINNPALTFQYILAGSAIVADRTVTLPLLTAGDTFVFENFTQTLVNKTLTNPTINAGAGVLVLPSNAAPSQTANGSVVWDSDNYLLTVGYGASRITMCDVGSTQTLTNKTLTAPVFTTPAINNPALTFQYIFAGSAIVADRNVTLPLLAADDVFVFEAFAQTLTNKTLTNPTINAGTGVLVLPQIAAPAQTANGSVVWDSDGFLLTVGTGAARKTMVDLDTAQTISAVKTFTAIPAFNGGTTGSTAPFTVDSTYPVTNLTSDYVYRNTNFDFIIDSNAKFLAWQTAAAGTCNKVLIKAGTWTLASGGIDLTTRGTKVVVGESGSSLVFSSTTSGLYYTALPTTLDYYMMGVSISVTPSGTTIGYSYCANLYNCAITINSTALLDPITGYRYCKNLTNCICTNNTPGSNYGFRNCTNLILCEAINTAVNTVSTADARGFIGCDMLVGCIATCNVTSSVALGTVCFGFDVCTSLTNCTATCTASNSAGTGPVINGFYQCYFCSQCAARCTITTNTGAGGAVGFNECRQLTQCNAECLGPSTGSNIGFNKCIKGVVENFAGASNSGTGTGYGFSECKNCIGNGRNNTGTKTALYYLSYADTLVAAACADTAAGGWNHSAL